MSNRLIQDDYFRDELMLSREHEKLTRDISCSAGGRAYLLQVLLDRGLIRVIECKLSMTQNDAKHVVEVVSNAARKLPQ